MEAASAASDKLFGLNFTHLITTLVPPFSEHPHTCAVNSVLKLTSTVVIWQGSHSADCHL